MSIKCYCHPLSFYRSQKKTGSHKKENCIQCPVPLHFSVLTPKPYTCPRSFLLVSQQQFKSVTYCSYSFHLTSFIEVKEVEQSIVNHKKLVIQCLVSGIQIFSAERDRSQ